MNILITGSGGFIGTHLKESLKDQYTLYTPRSHDLNLLNLSKVKDYIKENKIDLVIHSASEGVRITSQDKDGIAQRNIQMFENLASCLDGRRIINLGSGAEYDKDHSLHKVKEEEFGVFIPKTPYGYSKYIISNQINDMKNALNLRIFGVYGEFENPSRFTTYAIEQNIKRNPIIINQNAIYDFIYISDLIEIIDFYIRNETNSKNINICPTESISLGNLAEIINDIGNFKSELIFKKEGYNLEYTGSNTLLLSEISKFSFTSYEEGIRSLYHSLEETKNNEND